MLMIYLPDCVHVGNDVVEMLAMVVGKVVVLVMVMEMPMVMVMVMVMVMIMELLVWWR